MQNSSLTRECDRAVIAERFCSRSKPSMHCRDCRTHRQDGIERNCATKLASASSGRFNQQDVAAIRKGSRGPDQGYCAIAAGKRFFKALPSLSAIARLFQASASSPLSPSAASICCSAAADRRAANRSRPGDAGCRNAAAPRENLTIQHLRSPSCPRRWKASASSKNFATLAPLSENGRPESRVIQSPVSARVPQVMNSARPCQDASCATAAEPVMITIERFDHLGIRQARALASYKNARSPKQRTFAIDLGACPSQVCL